MNIMVVIKMVPDLVEELSIDASGISLDMSWLRMIINEFDDHALEQAILLKEHFGGQVTVMALEGEGVDDILFTASAKGADRLIRLNGNSDNAKNNHALARAFTSIVKELNPDLILTGVQANNDLDGSLGPLISGYLGLPYIGYVSGVSSREQMVLVRKEYPGGLIAEMDMKLPAVLGVQAAEQPPRYIAVSKVRQAMKTASIEDRSIAGFDQSGGVSVTRMYQPETAGRATMIEGSESEIATQLVQIFKELSVL